VPGSSAQGDAIVTGPDSAVPVSAQATSFPGVITLDTAMDALEAGRRIAQAALQSPAAAGQIDLAGLQQFDSSALAVLVALRREFGGGIGFRNPTANLRTLAGLYGVDGLLFGATR
jgi:phospholipid transport system transporter-binding protein